MQPRIHVITLAVNDLEAALAFYRDGLGFPTEGIVGAEFPGDEQHAGGTVAMFQFEGGLIRCPIWARRPGQGCRGPTQPGDLWPVHDRSCRPIP